MVHMIPYYYAPSFIFEFRLPHGGPENDRERREVDLERYNRDNPCIGIKEILTGFSKWSDRYISACSGQDKHRYQNKRMTKWKADIVKGTPCDLNVPPQTTVPPSVPVDYSFTASGKLLDRLSDEDFYYKGLPMHTYFQNVMSSGSRPIIKLSGACNPNFQSTRRNSTSWNCSEISWSFCQYIKNGQMSGLRQILGEATQRSDSDGEPVWETYLNCPICGCDANGADNLDDILQGKYSDE